MKHVVNMDDTTQNRENKQDNTQQDWNQWQEGNNLRNRGNPQNQNETPPDMQNEQKENPFEHIPFGHIPFGHIPSGHCSYCRQSMPTPNLAPDPEIDELKSSNSWSIFWSILVYFLCQPQPIALFAMMYAIVGRADLNANRKEEGRKNTRNSKFLSAMSVVVAVVAALIWMAATAVTLDVINSKKFHKPYDYNEVIYDVISNITGKAFF